MNKNPEYTAAIQLGKHPTNIFHLISFMNILLISGSKEHKILVFVQRIPVNRPTESQPFRFLFYDLNVGSNILGVGGKFFKSQKHESARLYSNALHCSHNQRENYGFSGRLTFSELYSCFYFNSFPFNRRNLITRPLTANDHHGHHGSMLYKDIINGVPYQRNHFTSKVPGPRGQSRKTT